MLSWSKHLYCAGNQLPLRKRRFDQLSMTAF
ncbi:hypothetical protein HNP98_003071 [Hymenobacter sp. 9A]|uniref:Uncharacterized protein n=1 Tax=Hymenobacter caeli TaxID=2735894 RepID=A0ABX2FT98_9BACT|nr:hypothetical protein [Hymenobacter caeli]